MRSALRLLGFCMCSFPACRPRACCHPCCLDFSLSLQEPDDEVWKFADLEGMVQFLKIAAAEGRFQPDPLIPITSKPSVEIYNRVLADFQNRAN